MASAKDREISVRHGGKLTPVKLLAGNAFTLAYVTAQINQKIPAFDSTFELCYNDPSGTEKEDYTLDTDEDLKEAFMKFDAVSPPMKAKFVTMKKAASGPLPAPPSASSDSVSATDQRIKLLLERFEQLESRLLPTPVRAKTPPREDGQDMDAQSPAFKPESSPTVEFIGTATPEGLRAQRIRRYDVSHEQGIAPTDAWLSKSQRSFLSKMLEALKADSCSKAVEARYTQEKLQEIAAKVKEASEDEEYLTEMEWRERVFAKLLDPLSDRFKSNADFELPLLTPGKRRIAKGRSTQNSYKPDKVFAQWNGKLHADFMAWVNSCGVVVGGLILACLVVEMKNAKQQDKDLMKLPGEQLLYMQYQAKALTALGVSPADKIASRLPFCPGVHIDGKSFRFTFMSTEMIDGWRQWYVLPKVSWHDTKSVIRVASAVDVLIDECERYWRSWESLVRTRRSISLLAAGPRAPLVPAAASAAQSDDDETVSAADFSVHDLFSLRRSSFRWVSALPDCLRPLAHNVYLRKSKRGHLSVVKCFSADAASRAEHELATLLALPTRSPHFVHLLRGREQPHGGYWIELEYIPTQARRYFATTLNGMKCYVQTLLEALQSLHALGVVHGDVKQTNALFDSRCQRTRLIDFGNAQIAPFRGRIGGTPGYRAPETLRGYADLSSDIFSAGCVLASLMFGVCWERDVCHLFYKKPLYLCQEIVRREPVLWCPEAWDLLQLLVNPTFSERPVASVCLQHAFFTRT